MILIKIIFQKLMLIPIETLIKNKYSNEIISSKYNEIYNQLEKY